MDQASHEEMLAAFGPFRVIFEPMGDDTTPYLSLLHLDDARSLEVVRAIKAATKVFDSANRDSTNRDSTNYILNLLSGVNWRPHIVGAIAVYYDSDVDATSQAWAALDAGTWVTPQIAAILSKCDRKFVANAAFRLNALCPLTNNARHAIDSPIERHSAQGRAELHHRCSKLAASLYSLVPDNLRDQLSANAQLQTLIAGDCDGSAEIATSWLETFLELDAKLK